MGLRKALAKQREEESALAKQIPLNETTCKGNLA